MTKKTYIFNQPSYKTPLIPISNFVRRHPNIAHLSIFWIIIKSGYNAYRNKYTSDSWIDSSEAVVKALENVGCIFEIEGLQHIHNIKEPCVIIGNHMSTLETFILPSIIRPWKPVSFVVKRSLVAYPFFGKVLSSQNPIVINRINPKEDFVTILKEGSRHLKNGTSIILFPQGTRSYEFKSNQFNSMGIKLARHTNVPIIPLAIKSDAWGLGKIIAELGAIQPKKTIHFSFEEPFYIHGSGKIEHQQVISFIQKKLSQWNTIENNTIK